MHFVHLQGKKKKEKKWQDTAKNKSFQEDSDEDLQEKDLSLVSN